MKINISYEGNIFEDRETIEILTKAHDMHGAIWDARALIKDRLKHGDPNEDAEAFLEQLKQVLYVEGIIWN